MTTNNEIFAAGLQYSTSMIVELENFMDTKHLNDHERVWFYQIAAHIAKIQVSIMNSDIPEEISEIRFAELWSLVADWARIYMLSSMQGYNEFCRKGQE